MENIIENNKLIAEFMGFVADKSFEVKLVDGINTSYYYYKDDVMYLPEVMAYHSDWSWLMEVVEKIESLDCVIDFKITIEYVEIIARIGKGIVFKNCIFNIDYCTTKREAIYNACVEFIKWYNKNK